MNTTTIELLDDYFVEADELNHTLKKRYIGTNTKTGEKVPKTKTIGYYKNIGDCVERLIRFISLEETQGTVITLREYAERCEKALKRVEEWRDKYVN